MYQLKGLIKRISDTQVISDRFSKREFVVETQDMYPQFVSFQATQDKCSLLDGFQTGDSVEVSFNLRGREWTSPQGELKYFNSLEAWRIEKPVGSNPSEGFSEMNLDSTKTAVSETENMIENSKSEEEDDLPF
jgi:single-strand DNA-binding protein